MKVLTNHEVESVSGGIIGFAMAALPFIAPQVIQGIGYEVGFITGILAGYGPADILALATIYSDAAPALSFALGTAVLKVESFIYGSD